MESARGLFHKASIQSGTALTVGRKDKAAKEHRSRARPSSASSRVTSRHCGHCRRRRSSAAINSANAKLTAGRPQMMGPDGGLNFGPIVDGVAIKRDPFAPDAPVVSAEVPILVGYVKD
jgi:para-nitrobenzyl esterase